MKKLYEYVAANDAEQSCDDTIQESEFEYVEKLCDAKFGAQLRAYLRTFGYIKKGNFESLGIIGSKLVYSPFYTDGMIRQTRKLHQYFNASKNMTAIEARNDGDFAVVDSNDNVYILHSFSGEVEPCHKMLNEYLVMRFENEILQPAS